MLSQSYSENLELQDLKSEKPYTVVIFKTKRDERVYAIVRLLIFNGLARGESEVAKKIGRSANAFYDLKAGKFTASDEFITLLCREYPDVNREYIDSGVGDPLKFETDLISQTHPIEDHPVEYRVGTNGKEEVYFKELDIVDLDKVKRIKIPVVEIEVAASFIQENVDGSYSIDDVTFVKETIEKLPGIKYNSLTLVFQIRGDSMYPNYRPKEKILCTWIDKDWWDTTRDVCVISLKNGSLILKRVVGSDRKEKTLLLRSDNEMYGDMTINLNEIHGMWRMEYFVLAFKR